MKNQIVIEKRARFLGKRFNHTRQEHGLHILADLTEHFIIGFFLSFPG